MVRLVNIDIQLNDKTYCALISVRKQNLDLSCQIRYVDSGIPYIHPGDQLVINLEEGLKHPRDLPNEEAKAVVRCTTEAISKELKQAL
ncbi:MAG TPA: hypothetical protein VHK69_07905 [Chitinophagaceae bacterium]|jgi:hypothetical protein|nr:hypothetical protein [Chitinophagaceae bacterium]